MLNTKNNNLDEKTTSTKPSCNCSNNGCSCNSVDIEKMKEEISLYKDMSIRMKADYDNFRKEVEKNRSNTATAIKTEILSDLLPILDNWSSAWNHLSEEEKKQPSIVGIGYIKQQLEDLVRNYGIMSFRPNIGDLVDYTKNEVLHTETTDDHKKHNSIVSVVRDGYILGDVVVRPAGVVAYVEKENKSLTEERDSNDNNLLEETNNDV